MVTGQSVRDAPYRPYSQMHYSLCWGRILGRNEDKSLKSIPTCYRSHKRILLPPPLPPSKSGLKLVCNVNIVYGNLKSENSQEYSMTRNLNEIVRSLIRLLDSPAVGNSGASEELIRQTKIVPFIFLSTAWFVACVSGGFVLWAFLVTRLW